MKKQTNNLSQLSSLVISDFIWKDQFKGLQTIFLYYVL